MVNKPTKEPAKSSAPPRCPECDNTGLFVYYREGCETRQIEIRGGHAEVVECSIEFDTDDTGFRCEECGEEFSEEQILKILKVKSIQY